MAESDIAIEYALAEEGVLSDDEIDAGGVTKFGLSFAFLSTINMQKMKEYGMNYIDDTHLHKLITDMNLITAKKIYFGEFWQNHGFDKIYSQDFCNRYFDSSVLSGLATATRFVQRSIWAYMGDSEILTDDGVFGSKTLDKVNFYGDQLIPALRSERASYYREIVIRRTSQEKFINGWLKRAYK